jgi:hypothetical protein
VRRWFRWRLKMTLLSYSHFAGLFALIDLLWWNYYSFASLYRLVVFCF